MQERIPGNEPDRSCIRNMSCLLLLRRSLPDFFQVRVICRIF